jgi:hypothetical protein
MHVKEFILQIVEVVVIEVKASFQRTIRYPSLAFQQVDNLGENVIEGHGVTLRSASVSSLVPPKMTQNGDEEKGCPRGTAQKPSRGKIAERLPSDEAPSYRWAG